MNARGPILVTGGSGQLALALEQAGGVLDIRRVGRPALDFDRPETVAAIFAATAPAAVVNAAAWTAVDLAESQEAAAWRANCDGPAQLAALCARAGVPMIHVSTDYVFDGRKGSAYLETDATCPTGVYGRSKLAGERAVLSACPQAIVLRTSWVYSATGKNFVRTMLAAAEKTRVLRVVSDQRGCPTLADDLAEAILRLLAVLRDGWQERYRGVTHAAGSGWTTWHGLATATFAAAARYGIAPPVVKPIATADWPTPAVRPADSRLDCTRLEALFQIRLPEWQGSLQRTIAALLRA